MLALRKKSTTLALSAGLALTLAACGGDDDVTVTDNDTNVTQDSGQDAEPVAELDDLTGVSTEVEVDPSFLDGLEGLGVTPGVVGDAELNGTTLLFPITGGDVTYYDPNSGRDPYVEGEIEHDGSGLSLSSGETTVELTDFVVDPGQSVLTGTVTADGDVVEEDAELFFLDGSTLQPLQVNETDGTAVLQGTTVSLTQEAADLLNDTFGTDALTEFFLVGTATITVTDESDAAQSSPTATTSPEAGTEDEQDADGETGTETDVEVETDAETAPEPSPTS